MRRVNKSKRDMLKREYDFASMPGGVRGKYYRRYRAGVNLALLEPEVARAFPTDAAVNEALRSVLRATRALKPRSPSVKQGERSADGEPEQHR
jgi:hypothetical protein